MIQTGLDQQRTVGAVLLLLLLLLAVAVGEVTGHEGEARTQWRQQQGEEEQHWDLSASLVLFPPGLTLPSSALAQTHPSWRMLTQRLQLPPGLLSCQTWSHSFHRSPPLLSDDVMTCLLLHHPYPQSHPPCHWPLHCLHSHMHLQHWHLLLLPPG